LAASLILILVLVLSRDPGESPPEEREEPPPPDLTKGLVAYYLFDGNASDMSGNGNDGEVKGATLAKDRHGVAGKAYRFDGVKDSINCGDAMGLAPKDRISISAWIATTDKQAYILSRWTDYHGRGQAYGLGLQEGKPLFYLNGTEEKMDDFTLTGNKADIADDQWHHIIATWDKNGGDNNTKIFVDGKLADQKTSPESSLTTPQWYVQIGGGEGLRREWFFRGTIDDVRIYNRALSPEEVKALYDLEKPKPLVWDFTHHYGNVMDPAADTYLHSKVNAVKYAENAGNACYWAPEVPGKEASVTYKYSFPRKTGQAWLNAILWSYNFEEGRFGKGSLWASKDGENWIQIIDAPTPAGKNGPYHNAPYHVREHLPQAVLGARELWLQARMQTEGLNILSQFSRYGLRDFSGEVYSLRVNLEAEDITKGLVAYYPFNGNAKDESGNGNDGVIEGVEFDQGIGEDGKAAKFNGAGSRIKFATKALPSGNDPVTMSLFVKITGALTNSTEEFHIGRGDPPQSFFGFFGNHLPGMPQDKIHYRFTNWTTHTDFKTVKRDEWNSLVVTHDGTTLITYVNGKKVESKPYTLQTAGDTLFVGQREDDPYRKTVGMVDQLRIYNRALSAEEVKALYDFEKPKK
jgi:hypothetical protein